MNLHEGIAVAVALVACVFDLRRRRIPNVLTFGAALAAFVVSALTGGPAAVGASVAGLFVHLMPVFGTILAWLFLGERLQLFHVAGIALILTGIYVTSRTAAPPVPAAPE